MDDKESSQEIMGVIAFIIYVLVKLFTPGNY